MDQSIPTRIRPFPNQRPRKNRPPLIDEVVAKPASIRLQRLDEQTIVASVNTTDESLDFKFTASAPLLMWHDGREHPTLGSCQPAPHPKRPTGMALYEADGVYIHIENLDRSLYWIGVFKDDRDCHLHIAATDGRKAVRLVQTNVASTFHARTCCQTVG